jgi:putative ABC transport system permease protein
MPEREPNAPDWPGEIRAAIAALHLTATQEAAIVEELAQHLSEKCQELLDSGASSEDARREVLAELNEEKLKSELRTTLTPEPPRISPGSDGAEDRAGLIAGVGKDLRLAARLLRLNPGFAIIAILSLALGIGANTAIFQLIDAVLLRTLPVPSPQELADIRLVHNGRMGSSVSRQHEFSSAIWEQLRARQQGFSDIAAWSTESFELGQGGEAHRAQGLWVSGDFFRVLQVNPVVGRLFSATNDYAGCGDQGVVISYAFWQRDFGGRADVLGAKLSLDRHSFEIIGITPPSFYGLEVGHNFDVALPVCSEPLLHTESPWSSSSTTWWFDAIGRLNPGWSFERATAQLASAAPSIFTATLPPQYDAITRNNYLKFSFRAQPAATGVSPLRKEYADPLYLLLTISGFVLLIACANLANLMLARGSARQREMAVRLTLGASPSRLIRQLLVESLLLAAIGAALGVILAQIVATSLVGGISTAQDSVFLALPHDWRVLAFTAAVAVLTCLLFGVAPTVQAVKTEPGTVIKTGGRVSTTGRERFLVRRALIVSQVAFSLVLFVAAVLFLRTFQNLLNLNPGFRPENVLVTDFDFSPLKIPPGRRIEYNRELLAKIRAIPGVISAAQTAIVPLSGNGWNDFINVPSTGIQRKLSDFNSARSDYFRTLDIPILSGRDFNDSDTMNSPLVAIVNEAFAKAFLGGAGADSVGKTFGVMQDGGKPDKIYQVIGIVPDTKYLNLREDYAPIAFVAQTQDPAQDLDSTIMIRSNESFQSLIPSLKEMAAKESPEIVLTFTGLRTSIRQQLGRERLMAALSSFYGVLAALLSMVGLYGMMSYAVARRRNEIGIRMALGASKSNIASLVVREALALLSIGVAIGLIIVFAAGHAVQAMLFGLHSTDPLTLGVAIAGMLVVAISASLLPAQRAASVHPMQTLREE